MVSGRCTTGAFGLSWYHYGARFYDGALARWTTMDPADEFQSPYVYVGGDPVNLVDPDGRQSISCLPPRDCSEPAPSFGAGVGVATGIYTGGGRFSTFMLDKGPMSKAEFARANSGRMFSPSRMANEYGRYADDYALRWDAVGKVSRGLGAGLVAIESVAYVYEAGNNVYEGDYVSAGRTTSGFARSIGGGIGGVKLGGMASGMCGPAAGYCALVTVPAGGIYGGIKGEEAAEALYDGLVNAFTPVEPLPNDRRGLAPADATQVNVNQLNVDQ